MICISGKHPHHFVSFSHRFRHRGTIIWCNHNWIQTNKPILPGRPTFHGFHWSTPKDLAGFLWLVGGRKGIKACPEEVGPKCLRRIHRSEPKSETMDHYYHNTCARALVGTRAWNCLSKASHSTKICESEDWEQEQRVLLKDYVTCRAMVLVSFRRIVPPPIQNLGSATKTRDDPDTEMLTVCSMVIHPILCMLQALIFDSLDKGHLT